MNSYSPPFKVIVCIIVTLFLIMAVSFVYVFTQGNFFTEIATIVALPWGKVTLIDLYIGFTLLSLWVFWREANHVKAIIILICIFILGNFFSCLYILYAMYQSGGNMQRFINGDTVPDI